MESQLFPDQLKGVLIGSLLIIFRKKISIFLEKFYKNFPISKIISQSYDISYRVNPIYITILGLVIIGIAIWSFILTR
jgi:hypothetical protein